MCLSKESAGVFRAAFVFKVSSGSFIYQVGFQHVYDYEMYEWAVGDGDEYGENGCAVLFDCLPEEAGHYVMCYYSYKLDCIISVSDPFEVKYMDIVVCLSEGSFIWAIAL